MQTHPSSTQGFELLVTYSFLIPSASLLCWDFSTALNLMWFSLIWKTNKHSPYRSWIISPFPLQPNIQLGSLCLLSHFPFASQATEIWLIIWFPSRSSNTTLLPCCQILTTVRTGTLLILSLVVLDFLGHSYILKLSSLCFCDTMLSPLLLPNLSPLLILSLPCQAIFLCLDLNTVY